MIVCLPFHNGDVELARLNLKLLAKWPRQEFTCVVCVDDQTDSQEIASLAGSVFAEVRTLVYPKYPGPNFSWPRPQNWAWQQTAKRMELQKDSWLWWEQDAVPLKPDWVKQLSDAYVDAKKPFLGAWTEYIGYAYMAGVAVYPARVNVYCAQALLVEGAAFDVFMGKHIAHVCHHANDLIHHEPDPRLGISMEQAKEIQANGAVLFHKCKDGSLQDCLLGGTGIMARIGNAISKAVSSKSTSNITVVITNYQRPQMLLRAFKSCVAAKVKNLVVSSSGATPEVKAVHAQILREMPDAVIDSIDEDRGCNEMWLRGVKASKTEWTHILHDDDWLLPKFSILDSTIGESDFYLWPGADSRNPSIRVTPFERLKNGVYSSFVIRRHLMTHNKRSISPVAGLFRTKDLVEVLEECEKNFTGPEFHLRPSMMVGNDMMIWLRMADKYPRFRFIETPLIVFGASEVSATCQDIAAIQKGQPSKLDPIYNATRSYVAGHPSPYIQTRKTKTAVFCYVPEPSYIGLNRFFQNMKEYRTDSELIYLSDVQCPQAPGLIPIPSPVIATNFKPQPGHPDLSNPRGLIGTLAWMFSLVIAKEKGIDHILYLETDCRVTCDDWDKRAFDEYFAWKHGIPICAGSPVCWSPFVHGHAWDERVIKYAYEYQQASGMAMAFEGFPKSHCWMYPNGALSILNVKEVMALWPCQFGDPVKFCMELIPFDLALGIKMTTTLKEKVFERMGYLTCTYSGCKSHHYREEERIAMIKNKTKVAVHEVKREDI